MSNKQRNYTREVLEQGRFTCIPNGLISDASLTPQERMTWIVIAQHQWGKRESSWPGITKVAECLGIHEQTARGYIHSLRDKGFLRVTERPGYTNVYELFYTTGDLADDSAPSPQATPSRQATPSPEASPTPSPQASPPLAPRLGEEYKEENKENKTINTGSPKRERPKRSSFSVPADVMTDLVDSYKRLKGIELHGDEHLPVQQAMKSMLRDGNTPEQIKSLMEALSSATVEWAQGWTYLTVRRKLPEWRAGKLRLSENGKRGNALSSGVDYSAIIENMMMRRKNTSDQNDAVASREAATDGEGP